MAFSYANLKRTNDGLNARIDVLHAQIAQREAESERLARDIESVEAINDELLSERARLAAIESRYQMRTEQLIHELSAAQQAVNELRQSNHEEVKSWANTRVPAGALRLLGHAGAAGSYSNGENDHAYIFGATGEPFTAVYRTQF
ncbi:hypothetical protein [Aliidiomarina maris]|uniref:Uncharacterized protein n=1 Tax=Aliidiomarina maris TaxID=531312 RepID=A0A327XBJ2_9GAMM|nr:hypothetical protein [Aliidiomarina maris]RAK01616.1 hypothetical protein B0I24_101239 [Aliidiomarina maris]RUO28442.1 hypothetical protein CWE07_01145 [Aliidiomarina maris]